MPGVVVWQQNTDFSCAGAWGRRRSGYQNYKSAWIVEPGNVVHSRWKEQLWEYWPRLDFTLCIKSKEGGEKHLLCNNADSWKTSESNTCNHHLWAQEKGVNVNSPPQGCNESTVNWPPLLSSIILNSTLPIYSNTQLFTVYSIYCLCQSQPPYMDFLLS